LDSFLDALPGDQLVSVAVQLGARCRFRIEKVGRNLGAKSGLIEVEIAQVQIQVQPNQPDTKTAVVGIEPTTLDSSGSIRMKENLVQLISVQLTVELH